MRYPVIITVTIAADYTDYEEKTYTYLDYVEDLVDAAKNIKTEFDENDIISFKVEYVGGLGDHFFVNDEIIEKIKDVMDSLG